MRKGSLEGGEGGSIAAGADGEQEALAAALSTSVVAAAAIGCLRLRRAIGRLRAAP